MNNTDALLSNEQTDMKKGTTHKILFLFFSLCQNFEESYGRDMITDCKQVINKVSTPCCWAPSMASKNAVHSDAAVDTGEESFIAILPLSSSVHQLYPSPSSARAYKLHCRIVVDIFASQTHQESNRLSLSCATSFQNQFLMLPSQKPRT